MAPLSNKRFVLATVLVLLCAVSWSQPVSAATDHKDYKDPKTHEKFRKRRMAVAAWQINQLKRGALVVKLRRNNLLISELKKRGDDHLAEKARLEQAAINRNTIKAFLDNYRFSKVYFIYSTSLDSLHNGTRSGIFLDTTLSVNPSITMKETFYLLAESDFIYNSSLGFVREDSAKYVVEGGNPSASELPIVVKNRYGHQLKHPFPYATAGTIYLKMVPSVEIPLYGKTYVFSVSSLAGALSDQGKRTTYDYQGKSYELSIPRAMIYDALSGSVEQFNRDLEEFYRRNPEIPENSPAYQDSKPYFY
jgi:hypothetical protein